MDKPDPAAFFDDDPSDGIVATSSAPVAFRYYDFVMAAFVAILLLSNIIGAAKLTYVEVDWWPSGWWPAADGIFIYGAGILFFPLGYVIGDILTEIYGFARARRVIWTGFAAMIFLAFMSYVVVSLPAFDQWTCSASDSLEIAGNTQSVPGSICQQTYESVFGSTWRIVLASITAFWAGEFVNSYVMAKMKVWTKGKALWTRTIGSTVVGQGVDSLIFYPIAFYGIWTTEAVVTVMVTNWLLKVLWEAALTPVTYAVVNRLKKAEGIDLFDTDTDFSPFSGKERRDQD
ncbi:queuosine precursor transporter [Erythrobacter ani]|uniref:Probable queuosine precursor transporter n=1 Tax=Erythrobacter ani TaxID=2827235 RepID=A0ABS6SN33_9SPHN|nr:queuosine precursor transporter [Erythrobacter ani]MBV7266441.1 queuosine precursor transporter [Erythrobacter ani]